MNLLLVKGLLGATMLGQPAIPAACFEDVVPEQTVAYLSPDGHDKDHKKKDKDHDKHDDDKHDDHHGDKHDDHHKDKHDKHD